MSKLEQELSLILDEELGVKTPSLFETIYNKGEHMSNLEISFKRLVRDMKTFSPHNRSMFISALKDLKNQSFNVENIFNCRFFQKNGEVKYLYDSFQNHYTHEDYRKKYGYNLPYQPRISGISIPLVTRADTKARLCIGELMYHHQVQISVELFIQEIGKWISFPCTLQNVKTVIIKTIL